ncbi:MAG: hypothetical protein OHK0044_24520 [Burkholderiaceae bacterium]
MSSSTRSPRPERRGASLAATLIAAAALGSEPAAAQTSGPAAPSTANAMTTPTHVARYVSDGRLAGEGRLTWLGFHVYDARLYAGPRFDVADPYAQPFVLELTYARKLEGKAIAEASRDEIERLGLAAGETLARWTAQMETLFPDVDKGRRIAGVYQPGRGARFYVDGSFAGSIDEPEFARAFFAIWLDPRTRAPRLRDSLLRAAGPSASVAQ